MAKVQEIAPKLHRLSAVLARRSDSLLLDKYGIGFSQFKILWALEHHQNVQQSFIARMLNQTEASISRQIHLMINDGLIRIMEDPADRRRNYILLTKTGQTMAQKGMEMLVKDQAPVYYNFNDEELELFNSYLDLMIGSAIEPEKNA